MASNQHLFFDSIGQPVEIPEPEDGAANTNPYGRHVLNEYFVLDPRTTRILRYKNDPKFIASLTQEQRQALDEFLADYKDWKENEEYFKSNPASPK